MISNLTKKILFGFFSTILTLNFLISFTFAQENFEIIDKANDESQVIQDVEYVGDKGGSVRDRYNEKATCDSEECLGNELASGIMNRNTLLRYAVKLVRRLSQAGLLVGALMIVYAGYLYATEVFGSGNAGKGNKAIKNAIIGVLVISFSYAIMKLVTSAFL